jgi:predicted DNA-binding transcriptional regulator AlpA
MTTSIPPVELLTERDVARLAKLSVAAIRRRRQLKQKPRWLRINTSVRYRPEDIREWLDSCQSQPETTAA